MDDKVSVSNDDAKVQLNATLAIPKEELRRIIEAWLVFLSWAAKEWLPTVKANGSEIRDATGNRA